MASKLDYCITRPSRRCCGATRSSRGSGARDLRAGGGPTASPACPGCELGTQWVVVGGVGVARLWLSYACGQQCGRVMGHGWMRAGAGFVGVDIGQDEDHVRAIRLSNSGSVGLPW